jgi:ribonuclease VapC
LTEGAARVLDASALLAHLTDEPGADTVEKALIRGSAMSAVNLAEVLSKLADAGEDPAEVSDRLRRQGLVGGRLLVVPFTADDAVTIAALRRRTMARGLSLGDRACLALALRLGLPAMTADRSWANIRLGVRIETIR